MSLRHVEQIGAGMIVHEAKEATYRWGGGQAETNQALGCCWLGKEWRRSRPKAMGLIWG